jgi:hypothetical protein
MLDRRILVAVLAFGLAVAPRSTADAQSTACQFTFGFKALRDQIPDAVGTCAESARLDTATGNTVQRTSAGLMMWRPLGNWTGFTNGANTWVAGPFGLQQRLSTARFDWEEALVPAATTPSAAAIDPLTCSTQPANDDAARALPLVGAVDGVLPPAIWSRSSDAPDRIAFRYYSFNHPADGSTFGLAVAVVDDGGYKVRAKVYAPDGSLAGELAVGARERQEMYVRPIIPGGYLLQLWNYRPTDVQFRVELRRA